MVFYIVDARGCTGHMIMYVGILRTAGILLIWFHFTLVCRTLLGCCLIVHKYSVFSHFYLNFVSVIVNFFLISVESGGTNESLRTGSASQRIVMLTCKLFGCFLPTTETNLISLVVYVNR